MLFCMVLRLVGCFGIFPAGWYGCPDYVESAPGGAQTGITGLLFYPDIRPGKQFITPGKRKRQVNLTCPLFLSFVA